MLLELKRGSTSFDAFIAALSAANLPIEDLDSEPFRYFSWNGAAWGGIGAGADALLRSIVVPEMLRGQGVGAAVTQALATRASELGTKRLWLSTTNAAPFFEQLGWRTSAREDAPSTIAQSRQFAGLCPASATLMVRAL